MSSPVTKAMLELGRIKDRSLSREQTRFAGAYTLLLFALVVAALMVALLFGTTVYSSINGTRVSDDESRAALSIISNSIRQVDTPDSVISKKGPQGHALVLVEHTDNGDYETRFYLYDGNLVQEYSRAGLAFNPKNAVEIAQTDSFKFKIKGSQVKFSTDQGSCNITLRSWLSLDSEKEVDNA